MTTNNEAPTPQANNDGGAAATQDAKPGTAPVESGQPQQPAAAPADSASLLAADAAAGDGKPAERAKEGDKPAGAPEKYEWDAPQGVTLDDSVMGSLSEVAKELNLPQDAAQKLVDKMAPVMAQRQAEQLQALQAEWRQASSGDQEFGGAKLTENMAVAKKALDAFATPEFRQLLESTGMGNHPEVIRTFFRAGKAISEDGIVNGAPVKPGRDARSLFPASNMNP